MSKTLAEVRKEAEQGTEVVLCVPLVIGAFKVLWVISHLECPWSSGLYKLHRYFPCGSHWEVVVDVPPTHDINECFDFIAKSKVYQEVLGEFK